METKIATNENQSKKLIELGLSVDTADMHYSKWDNDEEEEYHLKCGGLPKLDFKYAKNIPAWSLSALLKILPSPHLEQYDKDTWMCAIFNEDNHFINDSYGIDPVDVCFEMACFLLKNKLIK